jgi:hypothetical protein
MHFHCNAISFTETKPDLHEHLLGVRRSPQMDAKDVELWANTKYQQPWSAQAALSQLDHAKLSLILQVFSNGKLDQLVKVRLLLSCCLLPSNQKAELSALLAPLAEAARSDEDEFVRVIGHAVGDFTGQLDLEAVMKLLPMVCQS